MWSSAPQWQNRRMSLSRQQGFVEAPMEVVWDLISDVERHPEWWPRVLEVEVEGVEEGCTYRQLTQTPVGKDEMHLLIEGRDELRSLRIRCVNTGTFVRFAITGAQEGTFVDGEMGMDPLNLKYRVFDTVIGRRYFASWLQATLAALGEAGARTASDDANVEIVRRGFTALQAGRFDEIFATLADDVRWEGIPGVAPCESRADVEHTIRANYDAGAFTEAFEFAVAGGRVLVGMRMRGEVLEGPNAGRDENWIVFTLRDGKVIHMQDFVGRDEALRAVGDRGLEPRTSSLSETRSNQLS